ncbi:MAG TPA: NUDIX domain-containing protein [Dokdonella sp.]
MIIDKVALLLLRDRRLLCARSVGNAVWYLPGGKREPGESDGQALAREIREELDVRLMPDTLVFAGEFEAQADGRPAGTRVRSRCYFGAVEGVPAPAAEIEALAWMRHCDGIQGSQTLRLVLDHLLTERLID